jgi:hypothetical protein
MKKMRKEGFKMKNCAVLVMIIALFTTVNAFAQGSSYFAIKGGIFSPNSDEDGLEDFDTGSNIEAAFGYKVHPNFAIEAGLGYYRSELEGVGVYSSEEGGKVYI